MLLASFSGGLLADLSQGLREFALSPFNAVDSVPWQTAKLWNWREFWLGKIFDDRFVVVYFLPLVLVLLLFRRDRLRRAIIVTGLAFLVFVFGVAYAAFWLLTCLALYRLAERFAIESKRTDVLQIGPPLAAWLIVGGWYLGTMALSALPLPPDVNNWLWHHAPWVFPLGARSISWDPVVRHLQRLNTPDHLPLPLFWTMFWSVHSIGTAYLAVRMLHYFTDIRRELIPRARRTLLNFLAYTCYAPALIQGPIERFQVFQDEMDTCHERRSWRNIFPAAGRILLGVGKSLLTTLYFRPLLWNVYGLGHGDTLWLHPEQIENFWVLYLGVVFNILTLYLDFSGMCDVAVGIGWLFGYRQAENFAMPWRATSMRDLWRRWHITLSEILRDYLYIPLGGNRRHLTLNLCITFAACGLWHQLTPKVAAWGIIMGLMVSVNHSWYMWMKRLDARPTGALPALRRATLRLRPLPTIFSWLVTQHAFLFSLLILFGGAGGLNVAWEIVRRALGLDVGPLGLGTLPIGPRLFPWV
jgi:D-alanyl-lipoteichoic acid acyltransferase DltB (MBOAT superfamily)